MNDELCNPLLSAVGNGRSSLSNGLVHSDSSSSENTNTQNHGDSSSACGALEEARFRYKNSVTALRAVLTAIPNSLKEASETGSPADETEVEKLEQRASNLRKIFF